MKPKTPAVPTPQVVSLRDYFAALAMRALLSTHVENWPADLIEESDGSVSRAAFILADYMLRERAR